MKTLSEATGIKYKKPKPSQTALWEISAKKLRKHGKKAFGLPE